MNKNKMLGFLLTACFSASLLSACSNDDQQTGKNEPVAPLVKTIRLGESRGQTMVQFPGRVVANKKVDLAFQVSGRITQLPVRKGQVTKKGELLASLDARDFENDLNAKQATYHKTQRDLERAEKLLKSGTIAQATYDNAKAAFENAISQLRIAQKALDDTKLLAPYDGLVANRFVENYQDIQAKQKIFSYQDISHIDIVIDIPERDIVLTKPIQEQEQRDRKLTDALVFDAIPDRKFSVTIKEYVTEADPVTQTFRVVLTMPAPDDVNILPGMSATLNLSDEHTKQHYLLPVSSVLTDASGQRYVWLVDEKNMTAKKRQVQVGRMQQDKIAITDGVTAGDRIIVAGFPYLQEGMKVRLFVPKSEAKRE